MKESNKFYTVTLTSFMVFFLVYIIFYLWLDIPIALWMRQEFANSTLFTTAKIISFLFKPGMWAIAGLCILLLGYFTPKKKHLRKYFLISFSIFLAYILCGVLKFLLGRYRPIEFFTHGLYGFHFLSLKYQYTSTPSGVAATAFAALCALGVLEKKTSLLILLLLIATLISLSRIILTEHYPSDIIFGAYLGILSVYWCQQFAKKYVP